MQLSPPSAAKASALAILLTHIKLNSICSACMEPSPNILLRSQLHHRIVKNFIDNSSRQSFYYFLMSFGEFRTQARQSFSNSCSRIVSTLLRRQLIVETVSVIATRHQTLPLLLLAVPPLPLPSSAAFVVLRHYRL